MKKLLLSAVIASSLLSLQAEKVKVATFVVADRAAVTQAANKLGELSCNMMITGYLAGSLRGIPTEVTEYALTIDDGEVDCEKLTNTTAKLEKNVLVKTSICGKGLAKFFGQEELAQKLTDEQKKLISEVSGATAFVKVDDRGITLEGELKMKDDSELAKKFAGGAPIAKDALKFAAKNVVVAGAFSENSGSDYSKLPEVLAILTKHGVKTDKFLTVDGKDGECFLTLDVPALCDYIRAASADKGEKCSAKLEAIKQDIEALRAECVLRETPAGKGSLAIKNYESPYTMEERFAATLPDYADKPIVNLTVWSYYAICKAILPQVTELKPFTANLPAELKGGCAMAIWDVSPVAGGFVLRISADEIKSFGLASGVVMSAMMAHQMSAFEAEAEEEDEDSKIDIEWEEENED